MVQCHAENVDNGGECDEELCERVEDEVREDFGRSDPQPAAVADTESGAGDLQES